jgi:phospholipid/cholesterol/gamma-HCH transport system substrate-binding protein
MRFSRLRLAFLALATVVATAAGITGFAASDDESGGTTLVARFASAAPLVHGNEVKLDGVVVGEVLEMHARRGYADVVVRLDTEAMPLHRDARLTIRPVSLLGERYVDLERGSAKSPLLRPGQVLPTSQTGSNVDLDEVLNVFERPTSEGLAFLVTTLGEGLRGNGANADAAIRAMAPALRDTRALAKVLRDHDDLLGNLVDRAEPVAKALAADDGAALQKVVASADQLLAAAGKQQRALDATLAELPSALSAAQKTLGELAGAARNTAPVLRSMRPATDNLQAISGELMGFADALDPALSTMRPVLQRAEVLLDRAKPVAASLRAGGPGLRKTVASARPIVEHLATNMDNVFHFLRYWALATNGRDGLSHYLRVNMIVNPASVTGLVPGGSPKTPLADGDKPAIKPPKLPGLPPVGGLLKPPNAGTGGSATGLSEQQENGLMGLLFGSGT